MFGLGGGLCTFSTPQVIRGFCIARANIVFFLIDRAYYLSCLFHSVSYFIERILFPGFMRNGDRVYKVIDEIPKGSNTTRQLSLVSLCMFNPEAFTFI